jgi:hypothetical protein
MLVIRRIVIQGKPGQKSSQDPISTEKAGAVVHTCHPDYGGKYK